MSEADERAKVVALAKEWVRTPYHSCARIKGVGVDCAQFPAAVYHEAGLVSAIPLDPYSHQWNSNMRDENYLNMVVAHAREIASSPQPGDFVLFHVGRVWGHGAIVLAWPLVIHALSEGPACVTVSDASKEPLSRKLLVDRQPRFFTLWPRTAAETA